MNEGKERFFEAMKSHDALNRFIVDEIACIRLKEKGGQALTSKRLESLMATMRSVGVVFTHTYRDDSLYLFIERYDRTHWISKFLDERCYRLQDCSIPASMLYKAFDAWWQATYPGVITPTRNLVYKKLRQCGYKEHMNNGKNFVGIQLRQQKKAS